MEWITSALDDMDEIPAEIFLDGCREARRKADHPSKIIPTICAYADRELPAFRKALSYACQPRLVALPTYAPPPAPPICQADVDGMNASIRALGLKCGALVQTADGSIIPAPRDEGVGV